MGWMIVLGYALGFFVCWVVSFRMLYHGDLFSPGSDHTTGELLESILMSGFLGFIISFFWPIIVVIFLIWRWFVKPRQGVNGA